MSSGFVPAVPAFFDMVRPGGHEYILWASGRRFECLHSDQGYLPPQCAGTPGTVAQTASMRGNNKDIDAKCCARARLFCAGALAHSNTTCVKIESKVRERS